MTPRHGQVKLQVGSQRRDGRKRWGPRVGQRSHFFRFSPVRVHAPHTPRQQQQVETPDEDAEKNVEIVGVVPMLHDMGDAVNSAIVGQVAVVVVDGDGVGAQIESDPAVDGCGEG